MKPKKRKLLDLLMLFLLLSGIGILAYPFVSDVLNNYLDQQIISHYQQQAVKENEAVMAKIQENMTKKNQQLAKKGGNPGVDPFTKKKEPVKKDRTYFEKHTIGILTIPKINVNLPIFDQTTMKLLEKELVCSREPHTLLEANRHMRYFLAIEACRKQNCLQIYLN